MKIFRFVFLLATFAAQVSFGGIRVACVGDSITAGSTLEDRVNEAYPAVLGRLLGEKFEVRNFGIGGRTALYQGDLPYVAEKIFKDAKEFAPDVVIIKLGTNDSKARNWKYKNSFKGDLSDIVEQFLSLKSKPRVYLCAPVWCNRVKKGSCDEKVIVEEVIPLIMEAAKEKNLKVIDLHPLLFGKPDMYSSDQLHPNKFGAAKMAEFIFEFLKQNDAECSKALEK